MIRRPRAHSEVRPENICMSESKFACRFTDHKQPTCAALFRRGRWFLAVLESLPMVDPKDHQVKCRVSIGSFFHTKPCHKKVCWERWEVSGSVHDSQQMTHTHSGYDCFLVNTCQFLILSNSIAPFEPLHDSNHSNLQWCLVWSCVFTCVEHCDNDLMYSTIFNRVDSQQHVYP